jgi:hypothetical protein
MNEASELLALLDGLKERGLLGRAQVVKAGDTLVQLAPNEPTAAELSKRELERAREAEDLDAVYGAS